jgi:putative methanogenesis marker protein 8
MTRHVMEALGMSRIVIEDGKVVEIGAPKVRYCPLFKKYRNIDDFNDATIKENMEFRISHFGMCTSSRQVRMRDFLSFGISELLSLALGKRMLDAAVIVADGTGTCVLDDPEIVQGLGGRISGIVETEPIPEVIDAIGRERMLDPDTAAIDQFAGVSKAFAMRCGKVGVTITKANDAALIRNAFGDNVVIFAVHTTGTSMADAERLFDSCDVITACASECIREVAKGRALLQAGTKIPVYASSEFGKEIILMKLKELGKEPATSEDERPSPLN